MAVLVANRLIQDRGSLSSIAALVLAFIDGGVEWLAWAVNDTSSNYSFPDETTLVAEIQQGLHSSPLALLSNKKLQLLISPIKLMTFSIDDLQIVAKARSGDQDLVTMARLSAILKAHGVLTQEDLAAVPGFLKDLGVSSTPVFQCLGLNEMITLWELITLRQPQGGDPDIQSDAASFAQQQATNCEEFSDYYRAYMMLTAKLKNTAHGSAQVQRRRAQEKAHAAVQTLLPLVFNLLDCPQVTGLVPPAEVTAAVRNWLRQGRRLGFSRVSEGVCRIIDSTHFIEETGPAAVQAIHQYLANAESFLTTNEFKTGRISQDGRSCVLPAQSSKLYAELQLNHAGCITLRQLRKNPRPNEKE